MNAFTRIFTATEDFFVTVPIRQLTRHIQRVQLCGGQSAGYVFGSYYSLTSSNFFIDQETSKCLKRMSDAIDTWAEYIRVDSSDLILDEPYNDIIFQATVILSYFHVLIVLRNSIHSQQMKNTRNTW